MKKSSTYKMVVSALLIALSIVLTRIFSSQLLIAGVPASRISIGFVPIMLAGIILGPAWGAAVGAIADALGFWIMPSGMYSPFITLNSALVGLIPSMIVLLLAKWRPWLKILAAVCITQIVCSMFLQTYFLSLILGKGFMLLIYPRSLVILIMTPIYYLLVYAIIMGLKRAKLLPAGPLNTLEQRG